MNHKFTYIILAISITSILPGCNILYSPDFAPVTESNIKEATTPDTYIIKPGDSLYSIAWAYEVDVGTLAKVNNLPLKSSVLTPGTRINLINANKKLLIEKEKKLPLIVYKSKPILNSNDKIKAANKNDEFDLKNKDKLNTTKDELINKSQKFQNESFLNQEIDLENENNKDFSAVKRNLIDSKSFAKLSQSGWQWPTLGKVISEFSTSQELTKNKGIDIQGNVGQDIYSTKEGEIVYSGAGIRGYGNLLIIKHDNNFLSAYAHNQILLVKEGEKVKIGQKIARMGTIDGKAILHFEIRYKGEAVNPQQYLPRL